MDCVQSLHERFWRHAKDVLARARNNRFLAAVSGGADSTCLFHLLSNAPSDWRAEWAVVHLNHGLRGEQSDGDMECVRELAAVHGRNFFAQSIDAAALAAQWNVSVEMAARRARRELFESVAGSFGASAVILAHHADDQVETVLMRMLRSSGLRGWGGMHAHSPLRQGGPVTLLRPLLPFYKQELLAWLRARDLPWREDATNVQSVYERNRIRMQLLPELERTHSEVRIRVLEFAGRCRDEYGRLTANVNPAQYVKENDGMLCMGISDLLGLNPHARHSVLEHAIGRVDAGLFPLAHEVIEQFEGLLNGRIGSGGFDVGPACAVWLEGGEVCVGAPARRIAPPPDTTVSVLLPGGGVAELPDGATFRCEVLSMEQAKRESLLHANRCIEYVDVEKLIFPLTVRRWREGDWFVPLGMEGRKKLQDYFVDNKILRRERAGVWVVASANLVVWVAPWRLDARFRVTAQTRHVAKLTLIP